MKIAILAEKNSSLSRCVKPIAEFHGATGAITALTVHPHMIVSRHFSYPRGLKIKDYPLAKEQAFKPIDFNSRDMMRRDVWKSVTMADGTGWHATITEETCSVVKGPNGRWTTIDPADGIRDAEKIVVFADPDPSGCLSMAMILDQILPLGRNDPRVEVVHAWQQDEDYIREALARSGSFETTSERYLRAGRAKQRFDYNYALNANVILRMIQQDIGIPADTPPLSKYALQTLYHMRTLTEPKSHGSLFATMQKWRGTGRYAPKAGVGIGSPSSRDDIVTQIVEAGLADTVALKRANGSPQKALRISTDGLRLLDALHPDCEDADLPFRIDAWQAMTEDEAAARIDRYIKTFFGKMKRFAEREGAAA